jgi:hypothetical protein
MPYFERRFRNGGVVKWLQAFDHSRLDYWWWGNFPTHNLTARLQNRRKRFDTVPARSH